MKIQFSIFCFFLAIPLYAQIDYNKIVLPAEAKENLAFEEKLVQLAWRNHPDNEIVRDEADIAGYDIRLAKTSWLNNIRASGNINEFTINPEAAQGNEFLLFYPRYNFSVTVPFGLFSETSNNISIAKVRHDIAQERINSKKLAVRAEMLKRYQNYVMSEKIFQIQSEAAEHTYAQYVLAKTQFEAGEITHEEYNRTLNEYNTQRITKLRAENELLLNKLEVEELIGIKLEDIR